MGIGGTGVVTTSQLLATAAVLAGRHVRTLDRTGLAQKGGAVVSDLVIEKAPFETGNSIGDGACDLYLGYDLLVAADPNNVVSLSPDATAIVSTSVVPTGAMVSDVNVTFPEVGTTLERISDCLVDGTCVSFDLRYYAEGLFGAEQMGNMFMLGVAVQSGALSLLPEAIEEAIGLNGVAVQPNVQAFRRGRQFVSDRKTLDESLRELKGEQTEKQLPPSAIVHAASGSELERLVALRRADLVAYQNEAYARRYESFVEEVRATETELSESSSALSETVATYLYKLMAYKDEYEVARLALDPTMDEEVAQQFGAGAKVQWRLHPPTLKAMGMKNKIRLGGWFRPGFVVLRSLKRLRGSAFDPFGRDKIRVLERELIFEYERSIREVLDSLSEATMPTAVEIAGLPDLVRGYEDVKLRNVERYREQLSELQTSFMQHAHSRH